MRALATFIMSGRLRAMLVAATSTVLILLLPPLGYVGGGAVALVTLRRGALEGLLVLLGAVAGTALLASVAIGGALPLAQVTLLLLAPVWLVAVVLRVSVSLPRAVQAAAGLGLLAVVLMYAVHGDPAAWWSEVLGPVLSHALKERGAADPAAVVAQAARYLTGAVAAAMMLGTLLCVLLGRWWQALLYNPGGFREEFQGLRLDRASAVVAIALLAAARLVPGKLGDMALELAMVAMLAYLFVGVALVHWMVRRLKASAAWLVAMYAALVFAALPAGVLLAVNGLLDTWVDFRGRLGKRPGGAD